MGFIIDTESEILGLERRRESYYVYDLQRKDEGPRPSEHIFAYGDGAVVELSNEMLDALLTYFERNPDDRANLRRK